MNFLETDLYQLSMLRAYHEAGKHEEIVTFEGFVRKLPKDRNFLVFAGLGPLVEELQNLRITGQEIAYLKGVELFASASEEFWSYLAEMRFTCEVWAPKEGTVLFEQEPFIRVTGPLAQAQLIETKLLSILNYSTAVASKAARIRLAAGPKKTLAEFGFRRAAGPGAALLASRAAIIGGFDSTSNVAAGMEYGLPISGTMAHSFVMTHDSEEEAFRNYKATYGKGTVLIDTYEVATGVQTAVETFGNDLVAVRLDSGDKVALSRSIRCHLNVEGLKDTKIVVSDDMNEYKIEMHRLAEAPIDGYGVGTELVNPGPLGGVYKLVEITTDKCKDPELKAKLAEGKETYPGKKQVLRHNYGSGYAQTFKDIIVFDFETQLGTPLLFQMMKNGKVTENFDSSIDEAKERAYDGIMSLPKKYHSLDNQFASDVSFSQKMNDCMTELKRRNS